MIAQCKSCGEIFVPGTQRLGVLNPSGLRAAVEKDSHTTGEPMLADFKSVRVAAEKLNAERKGDLH